MTIGDTIILYRKNHGLSQREFSKQCGLSNGLISMLEKGINPNTQEPMVPTLPTLNLLAKGMKISINTLIEMVDDLPISLKNEVNNFPSKLNLDEKELITIYNSLNLDGQAQLMQQARNLTKIDEYKKCTASEQDIV